MRGRMNEELDERIRRIYEAIGASVDTDGRGYASEIAYVGDGQFESRVRFSNDSNQAQLQNIVFTTVHNVANLKDHLKTWARSNNKDPEAIKRAVDGSLELRVVLDLSNLDKHGPLRQGDSGYSDLRPRLTEFRQALTLVPEGRGYRTSGSVIVSPFGEPPQVQFDGTCVQVMADIVDQSGKCIGEIMSYARSAVHAWETLLAEYGLLLDETPG